ncbi:MAG: HK97-gp10 family putative phage morphogenesis protein [Christensenellales bacterium]
MGATFDMKGGDIFLRDLEKLIPTDTDVDDALRAGAAPVRDEMERLAPVGETGNLKRAIKVGGIRTSKNGRTITVGIHRRDIDLSAKSGEYYPAFVEYGHGGPHHAEPHPYIRQAWDLKRDDAWNIVKQAVIDQMNK